MIVHWPEGLQRKEMKIRTATHINDFMPTCLEVAGIEYPERFNDSVLDPLDGQSFLNLLQGQNNKNERMMFWEHEGNRAVAAR